jgi:hypothetical protein
LVPFKGENGLVEEQHPSSFLRRRVVFDKLQQNQKRDQSGGSGFQQPAKPPPTKHSRTMSSEQPSVPHVSGKREVDEPPQHGINDGSSTPCPKHTFKKVDEDGKDVTRDESLTNILISKCVKEDRLIGAIVSLGEGELRYDMFKLRLTHYDSP